MFVVISPEAVGGAPATPAAAPSAAAAASAAAGREGRAAAAATRAGETTAGKQVGRRGQRETGSSSRVEDTEAAAEATTAEAAADTAVCQEPLRCHSGTRRAGTRATTPGTK